MKLFITLLTILLLASGSAVAEPQNTPAPALNDAIGPITADTLLAQYPAFAAEYAAYQVSAADISTLQSLPDLSDVQLLVLFGSWCHDSEREVPRMLKLLQHSGVALNTIALQAVDRQKQHPDGLQQTYALQYTPTIIVLRDGQELGRIIERPKQSLAADLAQIINRH